MIEITTQDIYFNYEAEKVKEITVEEKIKKDRKEYFGEYQNERINIVRDYGNEKYLIDIANPLGTYHFSIFKLLKKNAEKFNLIMNINKIIYIFF